MGLLRPKTWEIRLWESQGLCPMQREGDGSTASSLYSRKVCVPQCLWHSQKSGLSEPVISEASDSSPTVSSRRWKDKAQHPALGLPLRIGILDWHPLEGLWRSLHLLLTWRENRLIFDSETVQIHRGLPGSPVLIFYAVVQFNHRRPNAHPRASLEILFLNLTWPQVATPNGLRIISPSCYNCSGA